MQGVQVHRHVFDGADWLAIMSIMNIYFLLPYV